MSSNVRLIIRELIKTVEIVSDVIGFDNSLTAPYKFLESKYPSDKSFLNDLKKWNSAFIPKKGLDNPETFIMLATLMMAQQSGTPESHPVFLKAYNELCENRGLHSFQKE